MTENICSFRTYKNPDLVNLIIMLKIFEQFTTKIVF